MQQAALLAGAPTVAAPVAPASPDDTELFSDGALPAQPNLLDRLWSSFKSTRAYTPVMNWVTRHRGEIILACAVPASFVYDKAMQARAWYYENLASTPHLHDQRVAHVQAQVRNWKASGSRKTMCTARPGFATMGVRRRPTRPMRPHLGLSAMSCRSTKRRGRPRGASGQHGASPRYLIPKGWALANMVEMDDLTVGGLVMGLGMSTSSHKFGLMQETVVAFELVLADGSRVRASETENPDCSARCHGHTARSAFWLRPS